VKNSLFLIELGGVVLLLAILARLAQRLGFSPIPLYLLAGLAFGQGGVILLVTADDFVKAGAEIGLILLLFSLGLEYSASELLESLRSTVVIGGMDLLMNFTPGFLAGLLLGWDLIPHCSSEASRIYRRLASSLAPWTTWGGWGTAKRRSSSRSS
jgi:CPA2 family monovalent cation:H+ antiporter-2